MRQQLRGFKAKARDVYGRAAAIFAQTLGDDWMGELKKQLIAESQRSARASRRRKPTEWPAVLRKRKLQSESQTEDKEAAKRYRELVLDDQNRLRSRSSRTVRSACRVARRTRFRRT